MRRRGFLKGMVAAAAGCLALAPKAVLSTRSGTLKPAWTKEEQEAWNLSDWEPSDDAWNYARQYNINMEKTFARITADRDPEGNRQNIELTLPS